jgi:hypothetical protein
MRKLTQSDAARAREVDPKRGSNTAGLLDKYLKATGKGVSIEEMREAGSHEFRDAPDRK